MQNTNIIIIRHGETEWNVAMRLQGIQNSKLTKRGVLQAKQAGTVLEGRKFDRIISSDLQRAVDTANYINESLNLSLETDQALRERSFGTMEGLTLAEMKKQHPDVVREYLARNEAFQIPNGESLQQFYKRVVDALNAIVSKYSGQSLLIVTHGGVLDCVIRMLFNYPLSAPRRFTLYNAAINEFAHDGDDWKLVEWGNIDHQEPDAKSIDEPGK